MSWGNAPFAVALGVVASFALLQVTGVLGVLAGGGHGDADHDVDADHDADDGAERAAPLGFFGFGTLPFSMIWQTFALVAGGSGVVMNLGYLATPGGPPLVSLWWTLPASAIAGGLAVACAARWLGPILASKEQEATRRDQLVGQVGVVISSRVDSAFGEVRIRDKTGHDLRVVCRLAGGARSVPRERESVVVVECDDGGALLVEPLDDGEIRSSRTTAG
jgi:membrane protein implicated in regulation of membrane protease activity